jgi:diguanylate cyclase
MLIDIQTKRQVWVYSAMVSAISIIVPVAVVGTIMSLVPGMPFIVIAFGISIAFFIPLFIAPPLSYLFISVLRIQSETIRRVDEHVRFDMLTGALNRSHFLDSVRARAATGMLMIVDADHFKTVNDKLGHAAGDEALCILVHSMISTIGPKGIVGRLGGEEFGVFLPGFNVDDGAVTADRICANVRALDMIVDGKPLKMTISIGGALHHQRYTIGHSLKVADQRLYRAKKTGRDRFILCDDTPPEAAIRSA